MTRARRSRLQKNDSHEIVQGISGHRIVGMAKGACAEPDRLLVVSEIHKAVQALEEVILVASALVGTKVTRTVGVERLDEFTAGEGHTLFDASFSFGCHGRPTDSYFAALSPAPKWSTKLSSTRTQALYELFRHGDEVPFQFF